MTAVIIARVPLTDAALLRVKQAPRLRLVVLAQRLLALWAQADPAQLPEEARPLLQRRAADLKAAAEAASEPVEPPPPPAALPPLDPALLALEPEELLRSPRGVDSAIEHRTRPLEQASQVFLHRPVGDRYGDAARRVHTRLFPEGRAFLRLPLDEQYQHVTEVFTDPDDALRADLDLLGVTPEYEAILRLNAHLGALLHITGAPTASPPPPPPDPLPPLRAALAAWLCVVQAAWPADTLEDANARRALLLPLLDYLKP